LCGDHGRLLSTKVAPAVQQACTRMPKLTFSSTLVRQAPGTTCRSSWTTCSSTSRSPACSQARRPHRRARSTICYPTPGVQQRPRLTGRNRAVTTCVLKLLSGHASPSALSGHAPPKRAQSQLVPWDFVSRAALLKAQFVWRGRCTAKCWPAAACWRGSRLQGVQPTRRRCAPGHRRAACVRPAAAGRPWRPFRLAVGVSGGGRGHGGVRAGAAVRAAARARHGLVPGAVRARRAGRAARRRARRRRAQGPERRDHDACAARAYPPSADAAALTCFAWAAGVRCLRSGCAGGAASSCRSGPRHATALLHHVQGRQAAPVWPL